MAVAVCCALTGCGSGESDRTTATTRTAATRTATTGATTTVRDRAAPSGATPIGSGPSGAPLVFFRRAIGADPLASELTVRNSGAAVAIITYGGISGERRQSFALQPAALRELRRLIARARGGLRTTACCAVNYYIYWLDVAGRGYRMAQHNVPARARPLMNELNRLLDAHTVRRG